jgi:LysR family hca operon transcriptional activator
MHCRPSCNTSQASSPERHIATRLIERGGRRLQLTPARRVFLDEARLALARAERVRQATRANIDRLTLGFLWGSEIDLTMRVMTILHGELDGVGHAQ